MYAMFRKRFMGIFTLVEIQRNNQGKTIVRFIMWNFAGKRINLVCYWQRFYYSTMSRIINKL